MFKKLFILCILYTISLSADELTRTNLSFGIDEDGSINPSISIPFYYSEQKVLYSSLKYTSTNYTETTKIDNFTDSKSALVSDSKILEVNYISLNSKVFNIPFSIGITSSYENIHNNEFGYIHDNNNIFEQGSEYYIAFDNEIELDILSHSLSADIGISLGSYFQSRLSMKMSPFSTIGVKQSTLFKPLVSENAKSSSSTKQSYSYWMQYDVITKIEKSPINFGLNASYNYQPLKYDISQLNQKNGEFLFETTTIDSTQKTMKLLVRAIFNIKFLGGLNPSIGYGIENIKTLDNITNDETVVKKRLILFGFEKLF